MANAGIVFRIAYAVWLLSEIVQQQPDDVKILVMYDIACTLVRHLKVHTLTILVHIMIIDVFTYIGQ